MTPKISLALPVYNGENYLVPTLHSILAQNFNNFELLITDNASVDATQEICRDFCARDRRIRYFRHPNNLGAAANFNSGFHLTTGPFFKWCAHDDLLASNFLEDCMNALENNPQAVLACGALIGIDMHGEFTGYTEEKLDDLSNYSPARRFKRLIARQGLDAAIFGLYRREALLRSSLHRPYYGSDCALLAELALLGEFAFADGTILYSRNHIGRSVNIHSRERLTWQNPRSASGNPTELSCRLKHLAQIAIRHRRIAPVHQTLLYTLVWALHPVLVARLLLELVGSISPSLRENLRKKGLAAIRGWKKNYTGSLGN